MGRQKSQSYSGALRTPITERHLVDLDELKRELTRRLSLLLEHYKIDPSLPVEQVWSSLALQLAFTHVPGFDVSLPNRKGRKRKWDLAEARSIVAAVDAHKPAKGIKVAIRSAIKQKDWRWGRDFPSIATRYHEARRQILQHEYAMKHPPFSAERLLAYCKLPRIHRSTRTQ